MLFKIFIYLTVLSKKQDCSDITTSAFPTVTLERLLCRASSPAPGRNLQIYPLTDVSSKVFQTLESLKLSQFCHYHVEVSLFIKTANFIKAIAGVGRAALKLGSHSRLIFPKCSRDTLSPTSHLPPGLFYLHFLMGR